MPKETHRKTIKINTRLPEFTKGGKGNKRKKISFRNLSNIPSTTYATFGLYRYPAKFIPHVVAYVLEKYAEPGMKIFDPFAGYGTAGIVSRLYSCNYEMWDLNPLLEDFHMIATMEPSEANIERVIEDMKQSKEEFRPNWSNVNYWFHEEFLPFLERAWGYYHSLNETYLKLLLTIPLLKVTRHFSYDDPQRQKLSSSSKSKKRVNSLLSKDWRKEFLQMTEKEAKDVITSLREYWSLSPEDVKATVRGGVDTLSMDLSEEKDILITSPPYMQSQEYIRQAKMGLFWLKKYSDEDVRNLQKLEIPYREVKEHPVHSKTFSKFRDKIKEEHLLKVYDRYFLGVLNALSRLQKKIRSHLFLFVGRASMRGRQVPIDCIFKEHFTEEGWKHKATLVDKIPSRRLFSYEVNPATGRKDRRTQSENLVILEKKS